MFAANHKKFLYNKRKFYRIYIYDRRQKINQALSCIYQLNKARDNLHPIVSPKQFLFSSQHPEFALRIRAPDFLISTIDKTTYP